MTIETTWPPILGAAVILAAGIVAYNVANRPPPPFQPGDIITHRLDSTLQGIVINCNGNGSPYPECAVATTLGKMKWLYNEIAEYQPNEPQ